MSAAQASAPVAVITAAGRGMADDEQWVPGNDLVPLSVVRMARLVTPLMLKQGKGAWVNITTFAAFEPSLKFPVSCAYRAAVGAFTKLYADRYAADGTAARLYR